LTKLSLALWERVGAREAEGRGNMAIKESDL
jgi:hypothetical protein